MKIYWFRAQAPRRVVALAKYLGTQTEFIEVDVMAGGLRSADYAQINPNLKAPALIDGDLKLWESSAIMAYLCIKSGSDLWPAGDALRQVEVLRWLSWSNCHWAPTVGDFYFEYIIKPGLGIGTPDPSKLPAKHADVSKYGRVLDQQLAHTHYICGDKLTIADFHTASMAHYWRESHMPLAPFTHVVRWLDMLTRIPAWANPWPQGAAGEQAI